MTRFDDTINDIIKREGGFVDRATDHGGPTNMGITLATLSEYRKRPCTVEELKALTPDEAFSIYSYLYVKKPGFDRIIDDKLVDEVCDAGVLHGTHAASEWLQEAAGVNQVDGVIGPASLKVINSGPSHSIFDRFCALRIQKIARIVAHDHTQLDYLVGWIDRATSFLMGVQS